MGGSDAKKVLTAIVTLLGFGFVSVEVEAVGAELAAGFGAVLGQEEGEEGCVAVVVVLVVEWGLGEPA